MALHESLGTPRAHRCQRIGWRVSAVVDFSGRMVRYTYYVPGNPNGADSALLSIRSPVVSGTPTGNNFPSGKTTTFTYSTGEAAYFPLRSACPWIRNHKQ